MYMVYKKSKMGATTRRLLVVAVIALIILAGTAYVLRRSKNSPRAIPAATKTPINYSPSTKADNQAIENSKNQPLVTPTPAGSPMISAPTPSPSNMLVQITGANVQSGNVHVGTLITGATTGSCVLSASKAGQNSTQLGTSDVRLDVSTYDCGVFNVPTSSFSSSGDWQLLLTLTSGTTKVTGTYDVTIP
jgi:hypothetical protein